MADPMPEEQTGTPRMKRGLVRSHPRWCLAVYVLLVIASNIVDWQADEARLAWGLSYMDAKGARTVEVDTSGLAVNRNPLGYRVIVEGDPGSALPPVVLLHGSPGAANGFERFAPELSVDGRRVIYMDLPGFGSQNEPWSRGSVFEDYSSRSYGRIMWRLLDAMGEDGPVHLVGWSNGGAVALRMIEQQPERVATLTLLAAVGAQENEGTGSYAFEHFKYKAGKTLMVYGAHLYPHFGLLGPMGERCAFLRFFDDTDQRDLGPLMERIDTPTMVIHGRHDFLIPDRAAIDHHRRMPTARLVMLDAMHFIPFLHPGLAAQYLNPFFARHDTPGVAPETGTIDLAPVPERAGGDAFVRVLGAEIRALPWWIVLIGVVVLVRVRPHLGMVLVMLLVVLMDVDFAVALLAMLIGRGWWLARGAGVLDRPWTLLGWVRGFLFPLPAFVVGIVGGVWTLSLADRFDWLGLVVGVWLTWLALVTLRLLVTWEGRQRIKGKLRRITNHEYYPSAILYLTTLWAAFIRIISGKGLHGLTAVNPGYSRDGGLKEERKSELDARFPDDPCILRCALVQPDRDTEARANRAAQRVEDEPELGGYPIIAKPDQGARGRGVRVIEHRDDLRRYCRDHPEAFVLQRYHPGPIEVGVLWIRNPETVEAPGSPAGFIYAINTKDFPEAVGDGKRSLRQLVLAHPRYRAQAKVFIERLGDRQHLIPAHAQRVQLGHMGNHAQGARFCDGGAYITPELSARIDAIADGFRDAQGRGFDIGRFDIRCPSYESLMRGESLGVVELNGLTSEPTSMYDPDRSLVWAWGVLLGYWRHVERLSEARIAHGSGQPIARRESRALLRDFLSVMMR